MSIKAKADIFLVVHSVSSVMNALCMHTVYTCLMYSLMQSIDIAAVDLVLSNNLFHLHKLRFTLCSSFY